MYKELEDPTAFRLIFSTYIMILQAETADEAKDWVECINNGEITTRRISKSLPPGFSVPVFHRKDKGTRLIASLQS